jgi:hypothetical protein
MKIEEIQYIIMCQKAKEIQEYARDFLEVTYDGKYIYAYWGISKLCPKCKSWVDGNYCCWCAKKPIEIEQWYISQTNGNLFKYKETKDIWLPKQEDLQKMFTIESLSEILESFHWFVVELSRNSPNKHMEYISDGDVKKINSMTYDQLWLFFVMKKLYKKVWNGKKWIRSKK